MKRKLASLVVVFSLLVSGVGLKAQADETPSAFVDPTDSGLIGASAEDDIARQIGGDPRAITFTEAIRPRPGEQVPIFPCCQETYDQSKFPPGTLFDPAGPWGAK